MGYIEGKKKLVKRTKLKEKLSKKERDRIQKIKKTQERFIVKVVSTFQLLVFSGWLISSRIAHF